MFGFTTAQLGSLLRTVLQVASGVAIGKGWINAANAEIIIGAIVTIGTTVWGMHRQSDGAKLESAAKILNDPVRREVADPLKVEEIAKAV